MLSPRPRHVPRSWAAHMGGASGQAQALFLILLRARGLLPSLIPLHRRPTTTTGFPTNGTTVQRPGHAGDGPPNHRAGGRGGGVVEGRHGRVAAVGARADAGARGRWGDHTRDTVTVTGQWILWRGPVVPWCRSAAQYHLNSAVDEPKSVEYSKSTSLQSLLVSPT